MKHSPNRLRPVFVAAFVMIAVSTLPIVSLINFICCAGVVLGGIAGVAVYRKELIGTDIIMTGKDGGIIGLLSGFLAAVVVSGITLITMLYSNVNIFSEMMPALAKFGSPLPPEFKEVIDKFSGEYMKYGYSPTYVIILSLMNLVLYPLFGALGGLLAVSINKKKK